VPTENLLWRKKDRITMLHALPSQALTSIWMSLILKLFASDIIFANHRSNYNLDLLCQRQLQSTNRTLLH